MTLYVDLDGTLLKTDSLQEALVVVAKRRPHYIPLMPIWILKGRAYFKDRISSIVALNPELLPYNQEFLAYLKEEHEKGRDLVLATGANQRIADSIAGHLGIFRAAHGSSDTINLTSHNKANLISQKAAEESRRDIAYAGNSFVDIPVWKAVQEALVVSSSPRLKKAVDHLGKPAKIFKGPEINLYNLVKAIRAYQWAKNLLLFLPLLLAHEWRSIPSVLSCVVAFFSFSLCASAIYILNDLADIDSDRAHPKKRRRPFAAGDLPILLAPFLIVLFLGAGLAFATLVSPLFVNMLVGYLILTTAYSFWLKKLVMMDAIMLAVLYTWRILTGALVAEVSVSPWLLMFSAFFFLSLAYVKRVADLKLMLRSGKNASPGRSYQSDDIALLQTAGIASGLVSILVMGLYVTSHDVISLYRFPEALWGVAFLLLYWVLRLWHIAHRGRMHHDPVVFAMRDRASHLILVLIIVTIFIAKTYRYG